ncbi:FUSC family protein [Subtercola sp. Z020]|uniref:FUSC family protein n=1 Tax=Subtercola sp. Z020 TaxID=2080582 RepID=UPI000CE76DAF|nr:FUSC family protein [Subtercola sp. Z020]PPF82737.1 FUSC family protein [Subtercola sp. Z020]
MSTSSTLRPYARSLVSVGEHDGSHRAAIRAGLTVLIPLLAVYALGHVEWSIYAAFGAFTAVYARHDGYRARLRMQSAAAAVMVLSVTLGCLVALLPGREWAVVAVASVWAMVVARVSDVFRFGPPGPLFAVFGLCAVASVPATAWSLPIAVAVSAASALLALAIGQAGRVRRRSAASGAPRPAAQPATVSSTVSVPLSEPVSAPVSAPVRPPFRALHIVRYGIAAAVAGSLSTGLGIGHPYWAIVAAIVPLVAVELPHALVRGTHRVLGTVIGLGVTWLLLLAGPTGLVAIVVVVALQMLAELFILRNYGLALLFVTPLALLMIDLVHPSDPSALIVDRGVETLLGTVVALVVACASVLISRKRFTSIGARA